MNWSLGKRFVICLTHDVDRIKKTYQYITHFLKTGRLYHLVSFFKRDEPYWVFEKIMKVEKKYKVRSTFFFLNESGKPTINPKTWKLYLGRYNIEDPKVVDIIRELDSNGWEIAVHGSFNSYKNITLLKKEKSVLEKIVGHEVIGIRQHYLNLKIPQTWRLQFKVGFKYDASFGLKNDVGFRENKMLPFRPFNNEFLVIPLSIMDTALFKRFKNCREAWKKCLELINYAAKNHALLTVLWHQISFNEEEFPGRLRVYKKIIKEGKRRSAWFPRCKDIYEFFQRRDRT